MVFALPSYLFHDFHLLNNPLPLRQREGFFFTPKHSHEKFFREFFITTPRRLFADFLARICDEGKGCLYLAYGGGVPFFVGLWACPGSFTFRSLSLSFLSLSLVDPAVQALSLVPCRLVLWASCPASGLIVQDLELLGVLGRLDYGSTSNRGKRG